MSEANHNSLGGLNGFVDLNDHQFFREVDNEDTLCWHYNAFIVIRTAVYLLKYNNSTVDGKVMKSILV